MSFVVSHSKEVQECPTQKVYEPLDEFAQASVYLSSANNIETIIKGKISQWK